MTAETHEEFLSRISRMPRPQQLAALARKRVERALKSESIKKLRGAPDFPLILHKLKRKAQEVNERVARNDGDQWREIVDAEDLLYGLVLQGLAEPSFSERKTGTERKRHAEQIVSATKRLRKLIVPLLPETGYAFEFQASFDGFALDAAIAYAQKALTPEDDEESVNKYRYAIYFLLMEALPELCDVISEAAEWWGRAQQAIKKPNDANAARLRFIRSATNACCLNFGAPLRSLVYRLTEIFFDCSDIDEAALSRLAPRPVPVKLTPQAKKRIIDATKKAAKRMRVDKAAAFKDTIQLLRRDLNEND